MPSIEWNQREWGAAYPWPGQGSEWSAPWGDVETHWFATILPRIHNFLSTGTVLEIAPGHGRWTGYLLSSCDSYIGVDLAEACVRACKERFGSAENATFVANDGRSLPMIANGSIDFVFSFDSLVHSEADVIDAYIAELARVLAPDGIGFIHHSNLGAHLPSLVLARLLERTVGQLPLVLHALKHLRIVRWDHARAKSMTAKRFADACGNAGLACVGQEIIEWGQARKMIDCLSLVARPDSCWDRPNVVVSNTDFMGEAFSAQRISSVYSSLGGSARLASAAARAAARSRSWARRFGPMGGRLVAARQPTRAQRNGPD
jgi:ubiquinone/menaquinone biosynthesis C-methylase UbiE